MSDPSQVPKLPGYHMEDPTTRKTTRVKTLEYKSGFTYVHPLEGNDNSRSAAARAAINSTNMPGPKASGMIIPGEATAGDSKFTPSYVTLDGKVLQFYAYMKEDVPEIPAEGYRVRSFNICYFLVDDSVRIGELKQENSGIAQGTFLKRHRVPSSTSADGYVSWQELRVGEPFTVYGRTLFINNCDGFTREFYATKVCQCARICPALC